MVTIANIETHIIFYSDPLEDCCYQVKPAPVYTLLRHLLLLRTRFLFLLKHKSEMMRTGS